MNFQCLVQGKQLFGFLLKFVRVLLRIVSLLSSCKRGSSRGLSLKSTNRTTDYLLCLKQGLLSKLQAILIYQKNLHLTLDNNLTQNKIFCKILTCKNLAVVLYQVIIGSIKSWSTCEMCVHWLSQKQVGILCTPGYKAMSHTYE